MTVRALTEPNPSGLCLCLCGCGGRTQLAAKTRRGNVAGQPAGFMPGHPNNDRYSRCVHNDSVLSRMRLALETQRRDGVGFEDAWPAARRQVRCGAWRRALAETKDVWRAAYDREPAQPREVAVLLLLEASREPSGALKPYEQRHAGVAA